MTCTKTDWWKPLRAHANAMTSSDTAVKQITSSDQSMISSACGITLDYSRQHLSLPALNFLITLAHQRQLPEKIQALMRGEKLNTTEKKPALHTALRAPHGSSVWVDGHNVMRTIVNARETMKSISEKIRSRHWLGYTHRPINAIVNIGIGGSDLGPRFAHHALKHLTSSELSYHFISDADPLAFDKTISLLTPETTLFIISSKSFTTQETLYNAAKALDWIGRSHSDNHFIAVTANVDQAKAWGAKIIVPIWEWVGGRYSFFSGINLINLIALGYDYYVDMLEGAAAMDQHFLNTPFNKNLPALLALLGVWNNNGLHIHQLLMLTYGAQLDLFVPFIQQLDMESNGKSVDILGRAIEYATGPIVWGGAGNQAQHSFYQLLCQGTHKIAGELISLETFNEEMINQSCRAKLSALSEGFTHATNPFYSIAGKQSITHIGLSSLTPFTLGALVALYEHKIFTQSVMWNINPFDQPGVETSKIMMMR